MGNIRSNDQTLLLGGGGRVKGVESYGALFPVI